MKCSTINNFFYHLEFFRQAEQKFEIDKRLKPRKGTSLPTSHETGYKPPGDESNLPRTLVENLRIVLKQVNKEFA